ncbi:hypothetical protein CEXT_155201 [Caerostris extrusa]|uniref:Uncharacterized protein n=1 Tax=Caerostris extrusa TaxID=172846 RepID=A0AAV4XEC6_CAEEX|nr:hypothetical protein CEXT_155201 [Caerostris extrusa]
MTKGGSDRSPPESRPSLKPDHTEGRMRACSLGWLITPFSHREDTAESGLLCEGFCVSVWAKCHDVTFGVSRGTD